MQTIAHIPTKTYLLLFGLFKIFLDICTQIYSVVFSSSRQINKQKVRENNESLCAGNKVFVKYQAQGCVNPNSSLALRTSLIV